MHRRGLVSILHAIILGITQGLTEFLPISSSGHLILVPWLFGWDPSGLAFDAALHLGTLFAVFVYFRQEILYMVWAVPTAARNPVRTLQFDPAGGDPAQDPEYQRRLFGKLALLIVMGSLPAGIVGL